MARAACLSTLCAAGSIVFPFGCAGAPDGPTEVAVVQESGSHTEIHPEDQCDPVTFGAICNPNFHGTVTLAAFLAELDATQRVQTWEYGGGDIRVSSGQSFRVDNQG